MKTQGRASERGMTLTEIMIVTVIMAILAGLAIPQFRTTVEDARANEARANLMSIFFAEKVYRENHPSRIYYPASGIVTDEAVIESNLRVDLNTQYYSLSVESDGMSGTYPFLATATRKPGAPLRTYYITQSGEITGG